MCTICVYVIHVYITLNRRSVEHRYIIAQPWLWLRLHYFQITVDDCGWGQGCNRQSHSALAVDSTGLGDQLFSALMKSPLAACLHGTEKMTITTSTQSYTGVTYDLFLLKILAQCNYPRPNWLHFLFMQTSLIWMMCLFNALTARETAKGTAAINRPDRIWNPLIRHKSFEANWETK